MVVAEEAAESRPARDLALAAADLGPRVNQCAVEALMVSLRVVVGQVVANHDAQVALAKDHEVVEALRPDRANEALGVSVQVGAPPRQGYDRDARAVEQVLEGRRVERVPVEDQVGLPAQEALAGVYEVAADLEQPGAVGVLADPRLAALG